MKNNVIDLSERRTKPEEKSRLKDLKLRIDLEQTKVLISTSLVSILFLVTLANANLTSVDAARPEGESYSMELSSVSMKAGGRGPDAVVTGTSDFEDQMAQRLSKMSLKETAGVGRAPSALQRLTIGFLEGKYAVRLENGKIRELEFSDATEQGDRPKYVGDRSRFIEENRDLLPVAFEKSIKVESSRSNQELIESYELVNSTSMPVAKVRFRMDSAGRLISMKVVPSRLASN